MPTQISDPKSCANPAMFLLLTLIGMRGDTFISLIFLDQILSAEFLSKISKILEVKVDINWVNLTPFEALIKNAPRWC